MRFGTLPTLLVILSAVALSSALRGAPTDRLEPAVSAYEEADKEGLPPRGGILFIGSSSIQSWRSLEDDFPQCEVINRGLGGAWTSDCTFFFDRIVQPYAPAMIVFYAGENDVAGGTSPEVVARMFQRFVNKTRETLGDIHIAYISMKPSPSRWKWAEEKRKGNALIRDYTENAKNLSFINVFDAMLGPDGKPRDELFVGDKLHMNENGYALWTKIVGEHLEKIGAPRKKE